MLLSLISTRARDAASRAAADVAAGTGAARDKQTPGSIFGFEVIRRLGRGAGSTIYAVRNGIDASHAGGGDILALKHVVRTEEKDLRFIGQLEAEHEVGHRVCHAGLRRTFDLRITRNLLRRPTEAVLLMEYFAGEPLDAAATGAPARPGPCSPATDARHGATAATAPQDPHRTLQNHLAIFVQTARALDALHAMGYVHCDLKPANILVARSGRVKVIDLGQAAKIGTTKPRIQGTPDYIAPEQVRCFPVTPQTDLYNFGATMYWALCRRNLPTLYTLKKEANSFLLDAAIDPPMALNPAVPEPLSNLVMQCVRTNPSKRPASAKEIGQRLETIFYSLRRRRAAPVGSTPATPPSAAAWVNRHLVPRNVEGGTAGTAMAAVMERNPG